MLLGAARRASSTTRSDHQRLQTIAALFAVCIDDRDYPASLEHRKIYRVIPDLAAARRRQIRIVDESGEDYLYPEFFFVPIHLNSEVGFGQTEFPQAMSLKERACIRARL